MGAANDLIATAESYKQLQAGSYPAWNDLMGHLFTMHFHLTRDILQGRHDPWGNDLTPTYRAALGVLEDIIARPAKLEARRAEFEQQALGVGPAEHAP